MRTQGQHQAHDVDGRTGGGARGRRLWESPQRTAQCVSRPQTERAAYCLAQCALLQSTRLLGSAGTLRDGCVCDESRQPARPSLGNSAGCGSYSAIARRVSQRQGDWSHRQQTADMLERWPCADTVVQDAMARIGACRKLEHRQAAVATSSTVAVVTRSIRCELSQPSTSHHQLESAPRPTTASPAHTAHALRPACPPPSRCWWTSTSKLVRHGALQRLHEALCLLLWW